MKPQLLNNDSPATEQGNINHYCKVKTILKALKIEKISNPVFV